jgi:hypothetical protein
MPLPLTCTAKNPKARPWSALVLTSEYPCNLAALPQGASIAGRKCIPTPKTSCRSAFYVELVERFKYSLPNHVAGYSRDGFIYHEFPFAILSCASGGYRCWQLMAAAARLWE